MISSLIATAEEGDASAVDALVAERTELRNREKARLCLHLAIPGARLLR